MGRLFGMMWCVVAWRGQNKVSVREEVKMSEHGLAHGTA